MNLLDIINVNARPGREFQLNYSEGEFKVNENVESGLGSGGSVWDCAIVLVKYMEKGIKLETSNAHSSEEQFKGKTILELGSGTGIAGIAAAMLGAHVILSDTHDLMDLMKLNVQQNEGNLVGTIKQIACLDWAQEDTVHQFIAEQQQQGVQLDCIHALQCVSPRKYIMMCDAVFNARIILPLVNTLKMLVTLNPDVLILMAHKFRHDDVDSTMFAAFQNNGFECTEEIFQPDQHPEFSSERIAVYHVKVNKDNH